MEETWIMWHTHFDKKRNPLQVFFNRTPSTNMVKILPSMSRLEKKDAARYPFINCISLRVKVNDAGKIYEFRIPKGFRWDGATIAPVFWIFVGAKTDNRFRIPSMIHDHLCNNKYTINFDRNLSSRIFHLLLLANGVSPFLAGVMYHAVDFYQRFQREWTK
jgi:hypothetical protein